MNRTTFYQTMFQLTYTQIMNGEPSQNAIANAESVAREIAKRASQLDQEFGEAAALKASEDA
jgi:hypothetical protein